MLIFYRNFGNNSRFFTFYFKMCNVFQFYYCRDFKCFYFDQLQIYWLIFRGGSRTTATFKMELFVIIVNGWKPLTIITKCLNLDVAAVLDPPLILVEKINNLYRILLLSDRKQEDKIFLHIFSKIISFSYRFHIDSPKIFRFVYSTFMIFISLSLGSIYSNNVYMQCLIVD